MSRSFRQTFLTLAMAGMVSSASAYSMLGAPDGYMVPLLEYNIDGSLPIPVVDIGGPMNVGEEYRWNIPIITYGYDSSFINYFGLRGIQEVEKAVDMLNSLRAASKLKDKQLAAYPTNTRRVNQRASALGLVDLKSVALGTLVEQLGLASPERFVWTLRARIGPAPFTYDVINRNFDPFTGRPSRYVNDTLYTYSIFQITANPDSFDAVEIPVDPLQPTYTAIASTIGLWGGYPLAGEFFTGLTRDDVGGLRELYRKDNYNVEDLVPGTTGGSGAVWTPVGAGNTNIVTVALRGGVDKFLLKRGRYDSIFGNFIVTTNHYKDTYITNGFRRVQGTSRPLVQPDVIFGAADLLNGSLSRSIAFTNNTALNGNVLIGGPGTINPVNFITFNKVGPLIFNLDSDPFLLTQAGGEMSVGIQFVWGSFDGTTNDPVVYPNGASIQALEALVLGGGGNP